MINKFADYEEMLNRRNNEKSGTFSKDTDSRKNGNQTSGLKKESGKSLSEGRVSASGIHSEYSRIHIPLYSARNNFTGSTTPKSVSAANHRMMSSISTRVLSAAGIPAVNQKAAVSVPAANPNKTDNELSDAYSHVRPVPTVSGIETSPASSLSSKESKPEKTQDVNDSADSADSKANSDTVSVSESADQSVLQEDSVPKTDNREITDERQIAEKKETEQIIVSAADESFSNSADTESERMQNPASAEDSAQELTDSTPGIQEKQNISENNRIFSSAETAKTNSGNTAQETVKGTGKSEKEAVVSRHARFFSAEIKVAEYVQKEAENQKKNSENVTHTRFISEQTKSQKEDNAKQSSSLLQMFQEMKKNDTPPETEKKTDLPISVNSSKEQKNEEISSENNEEEEAPELMSENSIEQRNPLFRNARQGLEKLPQPPEDSHLILENISEERQQKAPLLFSEKNTLPYRRERLVNDSTKENQKQVFLRSRASQFPKQEKQQKVQKEAEYQARQTQGKTKNVKKSGSPASQNQDTKEQKSVPQQTEQEQPKIQLLDSILRNPNATLGMLLSAARKDAGLSLESVSNTTRITQSYLVAMESDNGAKLPPLVFLNSYIRSLCQCYHLKDDVAQVFLSKVTSTEDYVLSDADKTIAILSGSNVSLNSGEQQEDEQGIASENEDRKIRSYIFIGAGIAAVAVVIIIAVILTSVFSNSRPDREEVSDNIGIAAVKQKPSEVSAAESAGGNEKATDSVSSKDLEILNAPCILGASSVKMQSKIEIK